MSIIFIVPICIVLVAVLGIFMKNKSSKKILLLGIELTLVGGIFVIGLNNVIHGSEGFGLILVIVGLLLSLFGFFLNND